MDKRKKVWFVNLILSITGLAIILTVITFISQNKKNEAKPVKQPSSGVIDSAELEKLLNQFMDEKIGVDKEAPGAAVAVVQDGRIVLSKGYGYADLNKNTAVDPKQTLFRIGSVTKTFTAAAIMQLVEEGKLDLYRDIQAYLDGIEFNNPFAEPVTIHHLLTHTSGFQVTTETMQDIYEDLSTFISLKEYIDKNKPPVIREPGTSYMYDNYAYNLLGFIIGNVTGMSYQQYMEEYILKPLKMNNTHMIITEQALMHLAVGYGSDDNPLAPYTLTPAEAPDGGMLTTAEDVAHFMIAQLNGGIYDGNYLWSEDSLKLMQQYQSSISSEYPDASYGYENLLESGKHYGQWIIGKGGDVPGYSSFILMFPKEKFGIFIAFNKQVSSAYVAREWNQLFIEQYLPVPSTAPPTYLKSSQQQLKRFEGTYSDLRIKIMLTKVTATGNGELTVEDDFTGVHKLKQKEELVFEDENGDLLAFKEDKSGNINYLKYGNPVSYAGKSTIIFQDVSANSVYEPYISNLKAMGIVYGASNGKYHPEQPLTRAQLAAMLVRMMGINLVQTRPQFIDTEGTWAERQVETAVAAGLMKGMDGQHFEPDKVLTRQEVAAILVPVFQTAVPDFLSLFQSEKVKLSEKPTSEVADSIKVLVAAGITGPDTVVNENGTVVFRGTELLTRQEAAVWFNNFIRKVVLGIE
ncbi:hypothetical protein acsn021_13850 [Anaerocolumna cellulosilytica]|uniref:Uncharacterized protein n=1 Tax=Anaerocolumna cellulosilytica TaxID=433286 RepID=A0A6S6QVU5_9FIRM|nr:serine hydrolase [Anaerocolumna cellulosilytica]MBB5195572.1 CubicO group peptidase (beta-lactamase class C family) [Anaerocolumna cellulosilytica]BCJ93816.1 hypothetical protein acsn021_13850 [Anaerocolumna cellulosilytica]